MGLTLARLPAKVTGYQAGVINALIDYCAQHTPRSNAQVRINYAGTSGFTMGLPALKRVDDITDYRFRLDYVNGASMAVRVYSGTWTRFDTRNTLTPDAGEDYYSVTLPEGEASWAAGITYYIYLEQTAAGVDPALSPGDITAKAARSIPTEPDQGTGLQHVSNIYWPLGEIAVNGDGDFTDPVQYWFGGDIRNNVTVPDTESAQADSGADTKNYSVNFGGNGVLHSQCLQIYNCHDANDPANIGIPDYYDKDATGGNGDLLNFRFVGNRGGNEYYQVKYCDIGQALENVDLSQDNGEGTGEIGGIWSDYFDNISGGTWWKVGDAYYSTLYGESIGRTISSLAIDLTSSGLYDSAGPNKLSYNWQSRVLFREDGVTGVLRHIAPGGLGWYLTFESGNKWTESDGLTVTPAVGAPQAAVFFTATQSLYICDGTYGLDTASAINSDAGFYYNETAGVTDDTNGYGGGLRIDDDAANAAVVDLIELYQ